MNVFLDVLKAGRPLFYVADAGFVYTTTTASYFPLEQEYSTLVDQVARIPIKEFVKPGD